jgi:hypothetical protein
MKTCTYTCAQAQNGKTEFSLPASRLVPVSAGARVSPHRVTRGPSLKDGI